MKSESVREPVFGGRSKNQQLGSVAESWAAAPTIDIPKGMFELEDDPPSPIEGQNMTAEEIKAERARRAALGIPAEKSGRPSIKDMEKDKMDKLRFQQLTEERARNEVDLKEVRTRFGARLQRADKLSYEWRWSLWKTKLRSQMLRQDPRAPCSATSRTTALLAPVAVTGGRAMLRRHYIRGQAEWMA